MRDMRVLGNIVNVALYLLVVAVFAPLYLLIVLFEKINGIKEFEND